MVSPPTKRFQHLSPNTVSDTGFEFALSYQ